MHQDEDLMALIEAIEKRDLVTFQAQLAKTPQLTCASLKISTRGIAAQRYFREALCHQLYTGDTALHAAATIYDTEMVLALLSAGAYVQAMNRRGAQPIHYAADGSPSHQKWAPIAQRETIEILITAGADPNAVDSDGTTPLHQATRQRSSSAVATLLSCGADVHRKNKSGSTALHLAVQNTGKGGSGSAEAISEQKLIIEKLLECGATMQDKNSDGKTVLESIQSTSIRSWINELRDID